jgi:hypothetical protein
MMDVDPDRWSALRDALHDAQEAMPQFIALQDSQSRRTLARATLEHFKAKGPQGAVSRATHRAAHPGEQMLADTMGRHSQDDIDKAFERSVAELKARVTAAEHDAKRIEQRHRQCTERLATLRRLVEACRAWAVEQGVVLPGEEARVVRATTVHIAGPPPGAHDFLGRPT